MNHLITSAQKYKNELSELRKESTRTRARLTLHMASRTMEQLSDALQANQLMLKQAMEEIAQHKGMTPPLKAALAALGAMQHIRDGGQLSKEEIQTFIDSLEAVLQPILADLKT